MTAALPMIVRTNENVQQVLDGQISSVIEDGGQCSKTRRIGPDANISGLTNIKRGEDSRRSESNTPGHMGHTISYGGNQTSDQAQVINGNVGTVYLDKEIRTQHSNHMASGHSFQVNGSRDLASFQALLASRK